MSNRKHVEARRHQVAEMREMGLSQGQIARRLNVTRETIETGCLVMGVFAPGQPSRIRTRDLRPCLRNGRLVRPFTSADDARLVAMSHAGETYAAMGRALGRRPNVCRTRLLTLAKRDEAAA